MMNADDIKAATDTLAAKAPVEWRLAVSTVTMQDRTSISRELDARIEGLARLRAYVDEQTNAPAISDALHALGVKSGNFLVGKVRRALGYAVPQNNLTF